MTLNELDAAIAACPDPTTILLSDPDFHALMGDPRARAHRVSQPTLPGFLYRGIPVKLVSAGPSRVIQSSDATLG